MEHKGHQVQFRKMAAFSAVTTALDEGVTPESQNISITSTTATVYEYGIM